MQQKFAAFMCDSIWIFMGEPGKGWQGALVLMLEISIARLHLLPYTVSVLGKYLNSPTWAIVKACTCSP